MPSPEGYTQAREGCQARAKPERLTLDLALWKEPSLLDSFREEEVFRGEGDSGPGCVPLPCHNCSP